MKWIEAIQIRARDCDKDLLKAELLKLIDESSRITEEQQIMVYSHVLVDTDFKIQIIHQTEKVERNGSALGLRLFSVLEAFGLVNHSTWVELK